MKTLRTLKVAAAVSVGLVSIHYGATAFLWVENRIAEVIGEKKELIVSALAESAGYVRPKLDRQEIERAIKRSANRRGVAPLVVASMLSVESAHIQDNVSGKGALGLMQVMPANASRCGLSAKDLLDAKKNIECGVQLFSEDLVAEQFRLPRALKRYNGGPKCVNGGCKESEDYARKVLAMIDQHKEG